MNQCRNTTFWQTWIHLKLFFQLFFAILYGQFVHENKDFFIQDFDMLRIWQHQICIYLYLLIQEKSVSIKLSKSLDVIGLQNQVFSSLTTPTASTRSSWLPPVCYLCFVLCQFFSSSISQSISLHFSNSSPSI